MTSFYKSEISSHLKVAFAVVFSALLFVLLMTPAARAQTATETVCNGLGAISSGSGCDEPADGGGLGSTVRSVINVLSVLVGAISVIMILVGGLKFVTSRGDSSGINSGRSTIIYAVVGVILVLLAQVLVRFVIGNTDSEVGGSSQSAPANPGTRGQQPR